MKISNTIVMLCMLTSACMTGGDAGPGSPINYQGALQDYVNATYGDAYIPGDVWINEPTHGLPFAEMWVYLPHSALCIEACFFPPSAAPTCSESCHKMGPSNAAAPEDPTFCPIEDQSNGLCTGPFSLLAQYTRNYAVQVTGDPTQQGDLNCAAMGNGAVCTLRLLYPGGSFLVYCTTGDGTTTGPSCDVLPDDEN